MIASGSMQTRCTGRQAARPVRVRQPPCSRARVVVHVAQPVGAAEAAESTSGRQVVVIGAGFAGFGAARHLSQQGYDVTLLDAQANLGGLSTGWRTEQGRPVEAGMKGFWYQYANIFQLIKELNLPVSPLTEFTTSGFWSPRGLTTEAPVFSKKPQLPAMIGQFVYTFPLYWALPLSDRLTMLPFLSTFADLDSSEETYQRYDRMSAYELFKSCGVSRRCYEEFLKPTLLVALFAPPEEISAAVMLETLYFYAIGHQNNFDVCWCRGSIAERIIAPLVAQIEDFGCKAVGNRLVTELVCNADGEVTQVIAKDRTTGLPVVYPCDALVFAVGVTGMQKLVQATPALAKQPDFCAIMNLKALDVVATRLWFDRRVITRYPANVMSGFEPSAGATFFNLNDLQDEFIGAPGTVISADFYHANALLPLSDEAIIARVRSHLETCEPGFRAAQLVDSAVLRFAKAVTHFSPGSFKDRPFQNTSLPNVFMAGDWVKGVPHGAHGLSQERAYVTGLTAANLVVDRLGHGRKAAILDVEPDEPHIALAKKAAKRARGFLEALGVGAASL